MRAFESLSSTGPSGAVPSRPTRIAPDRWFARGARASVQRAIGEFVAGRPVLVCDSERAPMLAVPIEPLSAGTLADLRTIACGPIALAVSGTRAARLGAPGLGAARVRVPGSACEERVLALAGHADPGDAGPVVEGHRIDAAAVALAKLARLLPAALIVPLDEDGVIDGLLRVQASDVLAFRNEADTSLRLVSSARVPLREARDVEWMVFRDSLGESWTLLRIGRPDTDRPVPVRLHSACLTGDAFGSRRCDCGDQLRMAIARIDALGGGVLLYLAQEGCGLGLANKMRAYRLQDEGLDTIDANLALGFERDERRYESAARMLAAIGIDRVALLTNNPSKLDALRAAGIEVCERIPLLAPVGGDNHRYLETKRSRAGHLLEAQPIRSAADPD